MSADAQLLLIMRQTCAALTADKAYVNGRKHSIIGRCLFLRAFMADSILYFFPRYEALTLLVFYSFYICLMHFNRRLDTHLNAWCLAHRDMCPRVIHDEVTDAVLAGQSTGKFGGKHLTAEMGETRGLNASDAPLTNYSRLQFDDDETMRHLNKSEIPDGMFKITQP